MLIYVLYFAVFNFFPFNIFCFLGSLNGKPFKSFWLVIFTKLMILHYFKLSLSSPPLLLLSDFIYFAFQTFDSFVSMQTTL